jgi:hypothetical protein
MKKTLFGLVAVAAVVGLAIPAQADTVFINSDGSMSTLSDSVMLPTTTTQIITQPAVIDTTPVVTTPVVTPTVVSDPVIIDRHRDHLLDVGIPGLFGVHLF